MKESPDTGWVAMRDRAIDVARRCTPTQMDAETAAMTGLADYWARGESRPELLDRYVRAAAETLRVRPLPAPPPTTSEDEGAGSGATLARIRDALGPAVIADLERRVRQQRPLVGEERRRLKRRATRAVLSVDRTTAPAECQHYRELMPVAATGQLDADALARLRQHTSACVECTEILGDRRAAARRWRLAGVVPVLIAVRERLRWAAGAVREHALAASLTTAVAAAGITTALVLPATTKPHPHPAGAVPVTTTPTTPPATTTPTTPPATTGPPATTTPTTPPATSAPPASQPTEELHMSATLQTLGTVIIVTANAAASAGTRPFTGDVVTFSAPQCGSATATTTTSGVATAQLRCPATALPITVTARDQRELVSTVRVI